MEVKSLTLRKAEVYTQVMDELHDALGEGELSPFCADFHHAIEVIGRRWTGAILRALLTGTCRFSEVGEIVPGLSDRLLSERLKELDAEGIVSRVVIPETPVRIEYRLTAKGRDLEPVVKALAEWAERWALVEENAPASG